MRLAPAVAALVLAACKAPERDCSELIWYIDDGEAQDVRVAGDFNGWNPDNTPLSEVEPGAWRVQLHLDPGEYAYQLVVDGEQVNDALQPLLSWDPWNQQETSLLRVADCAQPALEVESVEVGDESITIEATFLRAEGGARLSQGSASEGQLDLSPASGGLVLTAPATPGKHSIRLALSDADGLEASATLPVWVEDEPFDWADAVIYQVVTDRFALSDGAPLPSHQPDQIGSRLGGDLWGLTEVVESGYFEDLGVDALWVSPVYDNPEGLWEGVDGHLYEGYHGYWSITDDPAEVEEHFGGADALHALVDAAHTRGLRVLLDVVPNHVHEDHPWYAQHAEDWFHQQPACVCGHYDCPWSTDIETCWFTDYLPDLALEDSEVARTAAQDVLAWVETYDVDGVRVDAVPMMPRAAVRELIHAMSPLEAGGTRFYSLGETYTSQGYGSIRTNLGPFGLDGQFEFPVMWALRDLLAWSSGDAAALAEAIERSLDAWEGSGSVMAPFVGNHDVPRFLSEAAGDFVHSPWDAPPPQPSQREPYARLVAAQAVVFSLPGAPILYYGDEVGLAGATDPDCRRPMPFDLSADQAWTLARVQRLSAARHCSQALRSGTWEALVAQGPAYAHLRDADDGEPALLVLNASSAQRDISVPLPADLDVASADYLDAIEGQQAVQLSAGHTLDLTVPAWSARLFLPTHLDCHPGAES